MTPNEVHLGQHVCTHIHARNKHVRSQSERGLLCITAMPFARGAVKISVAVQLQLGDVMHSISLHSNTISIESKVR